MGHLVFLYMLHCYLNTYKPDIRENLEKVVIKDALPLEDICLAKCFSALHTRPKIHQPTKFQQNWAKDS